MAKTILLVDDDTLVRKSLGNALGTCGYAVQEATNGKEGLEKALRVHPDMIVSDVRMPELDGLGMVTKLRDDDWGKTVPVIIMSNDDTTPSLNQALQVGVTVYLSKSKLTPDLLCEQVKASLGQ
jgi:CheY-like chemotaxis protein